MSDPLKEKGFTFSVRIMKVSQWLHLEKKEYVLSRKVLDSGVNISLFIEEARQGENKVDFLQKYSLANKEAFKTNLLLRLLHAGDWVNASQTASLLSDCEELQKMLISAIKTMRNAD